MKKIFFTTTVLTITYLLSLPARAEEGRDDQGNYAASVQKDTHDYNEAGHHHAKRVPGPNRGRVFVEVEPYLEFLVQEDRTVKITALDENDQPSKIVEQQVNVIAGDRSAPTRLTFRLVDGVLVSDGEVPDGDNVPVVVQIRQTPDEKKVTEKFYLNMSNCPGCSYKEYACICDHQH